MKVSPTFYLTMTYNEDNQLETLVRHVLSKECDALLKKADNIVEVSIIEDLNWHIADDQLD